MDEYSSKEIEKDEYDIDIVDISNHYTFHEFMDELSKDNSKAFYSKGQLYFIKNDTLKKTSKGIQETIYPLCENVTITTSLMDQKFYETNIRINHIISEVPHNEIIKLLNDGYTLIHVDETNYYTMTLSIEDDAIAYLIADLDNNNLDPEECYEHYEIVTDLLFNSLISGTWFMLDSKEND